MRKLLEGILNPVARVAGLATGMNPLASLRIPWGWHDGFREFNCPLILLVVFSATLPALAVAQQLEIRTQQLEIRTQKKAEREPLNYLFYRPTPADSAVDQRFPLVLFLHGGGEGGDDIEKVKEHGLPKLIASGKSFPFFVVSPQNPSETQFWDDQQLIRLLDEVVDEHPIDATRIYLTGLSRGGYGAWRLAIQNPDRFAALVPISGGGPVPYVARIKNLPIWAFHGAKDPVIPAAESQRLVDAILKAGGNAKLTIYPDAEHDAWTKTYDDPELYRWLLEQQRSDSAAKR